MAPLPTIAGSMRVAISWRIGSSGPTAQNVMHFSAASTDTLALNTAIQANVTGNMWLSVTGTASAYQLAITPLDGSSATQLYSVSGTKWQGGSAGGEPILAAAQVISLRTAFRGRRHRGRIYLPFPGETNYTSGVYTGTLSTIQSAWDAFRAAMTTSLFPLQVASYGHSLHRTKNPAGGYTLTPVTWPPEANPVVSITAEGTYGTQRRRQSRIR